MYLNKMIIQSKQIFSSYIRFSISNKHLYATESKKKNIYIYMHASNVATVICIKLSLLLTLNVLAEKVYYNEKRRKEEDRLL